GRQMLEHAVLLNKWQGQVLDVSGNRFSAVLLDLNTSDLTEFAEFSFNEVSEDDIGLVRPGATFYWYIFSQTKVNGKINRETSIWFRRSARMNTEVYSEALKKVNDVWRTFDWDNQSSNSPEK